MSEKTTEEKPANSYENAIPSGYPGMRMMEVARIESNQQLLENEEEVGRRLKLIMATFEVGPIMANASIIPLLGQAWTLLGMAEMMAESRIEELKQRIADESIPKTDK